MTNAFYVNAAGTNKAIQTPITVLYSVHLLQSKRKDTIQKYQARRTASNATQAFERAAAKKIQHYMSEYCS